MSTATKKPFFYPLTVAACTLRLQRLQALLKQHQLDYFWVPSSDAHLNEYIPELWQRRLLVSGFTGSAGDLLVGQTQAWLFADSRYHEQADTEVDLTHITVSRVGLDGEKTLKQVLEAALTVLEPEAFISLGFDADTLAAATLEALEPLLKQGLVFKPMQQNLVDELLAEEAPLPPVESWATGAIYNLPVALTGRSIEEKLALLRNELKTHKAHCLPVTKLDEVAWLFNLRGSDVAYNPVFLSYALVTPTHAFLCCDASRLELETLNDLKQAAVELRPYNSFLALLSQQAEQYEQQAGKPATVLWSPASHTYATFQHLKGLNLNLVKTTVHPVAKAKALKTPEELAAIQQAHAKSSRAITRLLNWLEASYQNQQPITELDIANTLEQFYKEEEGFIGLSFNTIAGAGAASSIVHYGTPNGERVIQPGDWVLVDSGAHYWGGTTDCTRTVVYGGQPTALQKQRYTTVLKAHCAVAKAIFPKGTDGVALDAMARAPLWQLGLDYGHGTGHGVGAHLNVHEGPNGIHKRATTVLEPGHVCSIEPGYYEAGWGGIRLENLAVVSPVNAVVSLRQWQPTGASSHTHWYCFTPLTFVRWEESLIDRTQLSEEELAWLDNYQQQCVAVESLIHY